MIEEFKKELETLLREFREKLSQIRGYRLSLSFLENLEFPVYGSKYSLKSLAHISQLSPLRFKIEIWDSNIISTIEKELLQRKFGINVYKEGNSLIVTFPPLSEETKREILKELNQIKEEVRIKSRKERDTFLKTLKEKKENKQISEDLFFKTKEKVDEEIENFNKKIDEILKEKEKEILG